jgi:hypothetical protein
LHCERYLVECADVNTDEIIIDVFSSGVFYREKESEQSVLNL